MGFLLSFFLPALGFLSLAESPAPGAAVPLPLARKILAQTINRRGGDWQIRAEQEIFLSAIQTKIKSQGLLSLKENFFRLKLKGQPSSLTVFDGKSLWHQADIEEKTVFQVEKPSQIQILSHWFDEKNLFENFKIKQARKKGRFYFAELEPLRDIEGLSAIFIKFGAYIAEIRLVWEELGSWRKYKFSKPAQKKLPGRLFQFSADGFEIIKQSGS